MVLVDPTASLFARRMTRNSLVDSLDWTALFDLSFVVDLIKHRRVPLTGHLTSRPTNFYQLER